MFKVLVGFATACVASAVPQRNVLLVAIDDLRPQFGALYNTPEVHTPNLDAFFLAADAGVAMQHAYVQIAVCGPSRSSMLTSRRPDTTHVGVGIGGWCWCQRTNCDQHSLFLTLPTYFNRHGYAVAGNGKLFHPDACAKYKDGPGGKPYTHKFGDDPRAWTDGYTVEANVTQEQWGTIPGPHDPVFNGTMGLSFLQSALTDGEETDGMLADDAVTRLQHFRNEGYGQEGSKPFFLSVGLHKPHLPHIVPQKYFDMYPLDNVSLAPNRYVPKGFKEENFHADGTFELISYNLNAGPTFRKDNFSFSNPVDEHFSRMQRQGYFAAVSFMDAQVGKVLNALRDNGFDQNTIVLLWGDHGWHLGDTNSWGKMTNFESATHNTMLWRVPNATVATNQSQRMVEAIDIFPTLAELAGLPAIQKCTGLDQPPTVECVQGESYADLFLGNTDNVTAKQYAFSQWPYKAWGPEKEFRMGYTVRSLSGYRLTEYVPYNLTTFHGKWSSAPYPDHDDLELYDYNIDPWETTNFAANASFAEVVRSLRGVLREQYTKAT